MKVADIQQALFIKFLSIYKYEKKKVYLFYTIKAVTLHHTRAQKRENYDHEVSKRALSKTSDLSRLSDL